MLAILLIVSPETMLVLLLTKLLVIEFLDLQMDLSRDESFVASLPTSLKMGKPLTEPVSIKPASLAAPLTHNAFLSCDLVQHSVSTVPKVADLLCTVSPGLRRTGPPAAALVLAGPLAVPPSFCRLRRLRRPIWRGRLRRPIWQSRPRRLDLAEPPPLCCV